MPGASASGTVRLGAAIGAVAPQEFRVLAHLHVGRAPGQIAFTKDGRTAYVASTGSGRIARVDVLEIEVTRWWAVQGSPVGVMVAADQSRLAVSRHGSSGVLVYRLPDGTLVDSLETPPGPSLFSGPYAEDTWYVAAERGGGVVDIDGSTLRERFASATGRRPFPPAATRDGLEIFVPEYDDGTVSIFDLERGGAWGASRWVGTPAAARCSLTARRTPVAMAVTPDDSDLWVSCARSNEVWVLEIPVRLR